MNKFEKMYEGSYYTIVGCGGDLEEWKNGYNKLLNEHGIGIPTEWIHFTGSGYLLRTDAWSYPVLRLKRLGLSKTFRRLVITLTRRYGVSLIHLDASAECLPGLPTFDW